MNNSKLQLFLHDFPGNNLVGRYKFREVYSRRKLRKIECEFGRIRMGKIYDAFTEDAANSDMQYICRSIMHGDDSGCGIGGKGDVEIRLSWILYFAGGDI